MPKPTYIAHPLKNRRGTSQRTRFIEASKPEKAPIDGRDLADQLYLISEYARQINFYEHIKNETEGEYQELHDWTLFFRNSLPFQLAILSRMNIDELEEQYLLLNKELLSNPSKHTLDAVLGFFFNRLIQPVNMLYRRVAEAKNSFIVPLRSTVESSFIEALKCYISLNNSSTTFLCTSKRNFSAYLGNPWRLDVEDVYPIPDSCIQHVDRGKKEAFILVTNSLNKLFYQMISGLRQMIETAPDYIDESLRPLKEELQEKHQPHLALLFTFLELFKHFQNDLNSLTKKHLDFFYKQVLKMVPKDAVADKAHIIFELAKHLPEYSLPKNLLLKNGKDSNSQDIQFGLDQEIILDKAKIKDLRSLMLNRTNLNDQCYLEGIYMAPVANSKDGKGLEFKKEEANNWYSLGNKDSKLANASEIPQEPDATGELCNLIKDPMVSHPNARLGFVLSSPVLLLREGERRLKITLECEIKEDPDNNDKSCPDKTFTSSEFMDKFTSISIDEKAYVFTYAELESELSGFTLTDVAHKYVESYFNQTSKNILYDQDLVSFLLARRNGTGPRFLNFSERTKLNNSIKLFEVNAKKLTTSIFTFDFSGEEEWLIPEDTAIEMHVLENLSDPAMPKLTLDTRIKLKSDFPSIVFYNEKVLKEKIQLKHPFPLVKITINNIKLNCGQSEATKDPCCLKKTALSGDLIVSTYHYLKRLDLVDAIIDVEVCGVKNLIVQNDENLQDVNKPIYPFGPRPKVGEDWNVDTGANFYIGSKEIFCKNWQKFWINTEWKDKPVDLHEHYRFYRDPSFENKDEAITNLSFRFLTSVLDDGNWVTDDINDIQPPKPDPDDLSKPLHDRNYTQIYADNEYLPFFESVQNENSPCEKAAKSSMFSHQIDAGYFLGNGYSYEPKSMIKDPLEVLTINSRKGFVKLTLTGTSFQHEIFTYILTRQMMALADLADPKSVEEAIDKLQQAELLCLNTPGRFAQIAGWSDSLSDLKDEIAKRPPPPLFTPSDIPETVPGDISPYGLRKIVQSLCSRITNIKDKFDNEAVSGIPKKPYTPLIKSLSLDYIATADKNDIDIVHLYPYENTSKHEDITASPALLPFFDDEGTLFIGIENLIPGGQLSILFQLAETTADSEADKATILWQYLSENVWKELRPGFEVISDGTDGLTVSGIVTLQVPDDITNIKNTIMPEELYWIKLYANEHIKAIAQTIGIHTQAALSSARLSALNDTTRLENQLPEGSISKLVSGDFSVKKVKQPYASFGGKKPEKTGHFYIRVSEQLKHKGRAHMCNDYEKIVLEHFCEIYKAKCISHTMGLSARKYQRDLEVAPGYIVIAVIPDLKILKGGGQLEPKVPVSLLGRIADELKKRTSPFARFKVMNPRYEYIDVTIKVRLYRGKSVNFYRQKLIDDLTNFLAPWHLGDSEKLTFGQNVLFSDVVGFVEQLNYVDFITDLNLTLEGNEDCIQTGAVIEPLTARSILTGGEICVTIDEEDCTEVEVIDSENEDEPPVIM